MWQFITNLFKFQELNLLAAVSSSWQIEAQPEGLCALNLKEKALALVIETFPHILIRSVELQLQPVVTYLEDVGIPPENLGRVILCFPPCLLYDVTEELKPRMKKLRAVSGTSDICLCSLLG